MSHPVTDHRGSPPKHAWPLNRERPFRTWPAFDPGTFLDMNPCLVSVGIGEDWVIFCRYATPPRPGHASLWAVRVDVGLNPVGRPCQLLADGIDPRAVMCGGRLLVFYARIEMQNGVQPVGSTMVLAEFSHHDGDFTIIRAFALPKRPVEGARGAETQAGWEKNWVPFVIDDERVGLIYSHDPWDVLTLNLGGDTPRFEGLHRSPAIGWDYGTIRGGTTPVPYDDSNLITFFHAAQVIGERRLYSVGACVFGRDPPFAPVLTTGDPLLLAPYSSGAVRFGWSFAGSVIFPLGAARRQDGFSLVAGLDDGEIGVFDIPRVELDARLAAPEPVLAGLLHDGRGTASHPLPDRRLVFAPPSAQGAPDPRMTNFLRCLVGRGRTFVDAGAHVGLHATGLASVFDRVLAFEPGRSQFAWLKRNLGLNGCENVRCEAAALGDRRGEATLYLAGDDGRGDTLVAEIAATAGAVEGYPVRLERLDDRALDDVDFLKISVEGFEIDVLRGARETISRSRPPIIVTASTLPERRRAVAAFMGGLAYGFEFPFSASPELALCLPLERRDAYAWFV